MARRNHALQDGQAFAGRIKNVAATTGLMSIDISLDFLLAACITCQA